MTISAKTIQRLQLLSDRCRVWNDRPEQMPKNVREELAMMMGAAMHDFKEFAELGMQLLGFGISEMQLDIADFMASKEYGKKKMVMAQRGEAKSTLAALYAVWRLVQDQSTRILIVSGGEKQASDVAVMIIRVIEQWHMLCWLRPDKGRGDRTSYENYDVHCDLKPLDKSASVSCVGITANLQGKRADLLIPDDIETQKNSLTQTMRDTLLLLSKEFAAINTHGETLYLGTPQTKDSIYRTLANRGFYIRIWPGRYPTPEEIERYPVGALAPMITDAIAANPALQTGYGLTGKMGAPADPVRYNEEALIEKELDYGIEGFALQYMLDTTLSDAQRTKIKVADFAIVDINDMHQSAPEIIQYSSERTHLYPTRDALNLEGHMLYYAASTASERIRYLHKVMVVDPAGKGGDEVAFACGGATPSYIHGFTTGGLIGGMTRDNILTLINYCVEFDIKDIAVESNMGHGTVSQLIIGELEKEGISDIGVRDFYAKGQKEKRIIDTIGPLSRRHKIILHRRLLEDDLMWQLKHAREYRTQMSLIYQLANITYDRDSLAHDDRADCFAAMCQELGAMITMDDQKAAEKRQEAEIAAWLENPMGYLDYKPKRIRGIAAHTLRHRR